MKQKITHFALILLVLSILLFAQACKQSARPGKPNARPADPGTEHISVSITPGYIDEDKALVEKEIEKFHSRFNSGEFDAIYENSIQQFQQSQSMPDMGKVMKAQHKQAGNFKSVIDKRVNVIVAAPVECRAAYISQYANLVLTEMFIFVKVGSVYKLSWYQPSKGESELPKL